MKQLLSVLLIPVVFFSCIPPGYDPPAEPPIDAKPVVTQEPADEPTETPTVITKLEPTGTPTPLPTMTPTPGPTQSPTPTSVPMPTSAPVQSECLLINPGAETGDLSGWTILENGGNGWGIWGVDTNDNEGPYEGNHCFLTSYFWCKRSQEVDLTGLGYSTSQLDTSIAVDVEEWFGQANPSCRGKYYLKVELRDANHNAIASWDSGEIYTAYNETGEVWENLSHTFFYYGSGLRYIYWEDGGKDENLWEGYYGAMMDSALLTLTTTQ